MLTCWHPFSLTVKEVFSDSTSHSLINSSDFSVTPSHFPNSHAPPPVFISSHESEIGNLTTCLKFSCALYFSFLSDSPRPLSRCHKITWPDLSWDSWACVPTLVFSWLRLFLDWRCVEVGACCYWSSIVRQYHICNVLCTVPPGVQYTRIQYRIGSGHILSSAGPSPSPSTCPNRPPSQIKVPKKGKKKDLDQGLTLKSHGPPPTPPHP